MGAFTNSGISTVLLSIAALSVLWALFRPLYASMKAKDKAPA